MIKILIITLLFVIGVNANEAVVKSGHSSPDPKVGEWIPFIEPHRGKIDSGVLSPDGIFFYTLKASVISKWQLSPIKKIQSFKTNIKRTNERHSGISMFLSSDGMKMVLWTENEIHLWDLKKQKLLEKIELKTEGATLIDKTLITITKDSVIVKRDLESLKPFSNKKILIKCQSIGCKENKEKIEYLIGNKNYLYFGYSGFFVQVDTKTLKKIKEFKVEVSTCTSYNQETMYFRKECYISYECKYKITLNKGKVSHLLPPKNATDSQRHEYTMNCDRSKTTFPTSAMKLAGTSSYSDGIYMEHVTSQAKIIVNTPYFNHITSYWVLNNSDLKRYAIFLEFNTGEWVFIDNKGMFETSKYGRKHIKMKLYTGEKIDPWKMKIKDINDETFEKYNNKINLKGEK